MHIAIISHCDTIRFQSHINHQLYAERHGYVYIFDTSPTRSDIYKNKLEKILKFLPFFDYIVWTYINSGCMIIKNTKESAKFIKSALRFPRKKLDSVWNPDKYGLMTRGEQGILIHILYNKYEEGRFYYRFEHTAFNARPEDFEKRKSHFIVHFAGGSNKNKQIKNFANRMKLTEALIPERDYKKFKSLFLP